MDQFTFHEVYNPLMPFLQTANVTRLGLVNLSSIKTQADTAINSWLALPAVIITPSMKVLSLTDFQS
jgi:hypothetical protein